MTYYLLMIVLIAPNGGHSSMVQDFPTLDACKVELAATKEAMRIDPKGYKLQHIECVATARAK